MWDSSQTKHYRLEKEGIIFRAFVVECNGPVYVVLGVVIKANGIVDRWRDCISEGSIERKISYNVEHYKKWQQQY